MSHNIINEIRRMEQKYRANYGKCGEIICLDANAEARLTGYIIYELANNRQCIQPDGVTSIGLTQIPTTYEILQNGIRHLGIIICGMELKFDCPLFCIKDNKKHLRLGVTPPT